MMFVSAPRALDCTPRGSCPGCGASVADKSLVQMQACRAGYRRPSWTLYRCLRCDSRFRVFWPVRLGTQNPMGVQR